MLKQMSAQYIVTFVPKGTIVEHRQSIQDMLVEYFPAESYQVFDYTIKTGFPVEIPTELPRIMAISRFGHSNLQIGETELRLTTGFDQAYCSNLDTCWRYLQERIDKISALVRSISGDRLLYAGIVSEFVEEAITSPVSFIRENYVASGVHEDVYDILARMTYVKSDRYYMNIALSNLRAGQDEALGISVDVNNRYEYNVGKKKQSADEAVLKGLQDVYVAFVENDLPQILTGGGIHDDRIINGNP